MTLEEIQKRLQETTDPHEADFLYDLLFEYKLEAETQQAEAFPGLPKRGDR